MNSDSTTNTGERLELDLHMHTVHSVKHGLVRHLWKVDSSSTPLQIIKIAKSRGLGGVAVTDHDTAEGGLAAKKLAKEIDRNFIVIVGEEVSSLEGHILALGISETVPRNLSPEETIEAIHSRGGVAVPSHPFHPNPKLALGMLVKQLPGIDALEGFNSFNLEARNKRAMKVAAELRKPVTGGSDAHILDMIGNGRTSIPRVETAEQALEEIRKGNSTAYGTLTRLPIIIKSYVKKISVSWL